MFEIIEEIPFIYISNSISYLPFSMFESTLPPTNIVRPIHEVEHTLPISLAHTDVSLIPAPTSVFDHPTILPHLIRGDLQLLKPIPTCDLGLTLGMGLAFFKGLEQALV